ncbi:MAG: hypothetical protein IJL26_04710 [Clostridia bacterium]|nr:hypothetical protein [Clostridia bacterium]
MKKIAALLLFLPLLLTGCAGNFELDRELIVEAVGVDLAGDGVLLTVQALDAEAHPAGNEGSSDGAITEVRSAEGKTVAEALEKIAADAGREPVFSQNRLIVVGADAAREGRLRDVLDLFTRSFQLRNDSFLAAADRAEDIISAEIGDGKIPAVRIWRILETGGKSAVCATVRLYEFINFLNDGTAAEYLPVLSLNEKKEPSLAGTMILNGGEPAAELNGEETQLFALLTRGAKDGVVCAEYDAERFAFHLLRASPKIKRAGNGAVIRVECLCDTAEISGGETSEILKAPAAAEEAGRQLSQKANALLGKLAAAGVQMKGTAVEIDIRLRR